MKVLKKQETPTGNIALLAIFSAILVTFSLLIAFVPTLSFVLGFFLPLISAVAIYYTENKYIPFYVIGASAICLGATFFNIGDTLFFVIPSIISGTLFGFLRNKRVFPQLNLFIITLVQLVLHVVAYYLLIAITGVDLIKTVAAFLGISDANQYDSLIVSVAFMLAFSIGETALNYLIIEGFINRFSSKEETNHFVVRIVFSVLSIISGVACIIFGVLGNSILTIFFVLSAYFAIVGADVFFIQKTPIWIYVLLGILVLVSVFLIAIFNPMIEGKNAVCLISFLPICLSIMVFVSIIENKMAQ